MIASYKCAISNKNIISKDPKFDLSLTLDGSKKGGESIRKNNMRYTVSYVTATRIGMVIVEIIIIIIIIIIRAYLSIPKSSSFNI